MNPKISVVVCERNSEKFIEKCIASIFEQNADFELIVVDDYSTDSTKKILEKDSHNFKLIELRKHKGISRARNIGIEETKGEFIAFIDADCVAEKNWLSELLKGFDKENTVSVGGPNLTPKKAEKKEKIFGELLELISGIGSSYVKETEKITEVKHNPSCNSMYRKKTLKEIKGFNEKLLSNEDPELDFRIQKTGKEIKFNPKAIVYHHRKDSEKKIFKQAFWFGLGRMQAIKLHSGMLEWFRIAPFISITAMVLLLVYGIFNGFQLFFYFVLILFMELALISFIAMIKYKKVSLRYFTFLLSWFFGYGFGTIKGVFK